MNTNQSPKTGSVGLSDQQSLHIFSLQSWKIWGIEPQISPKKGHTMFQRSSRFLQETLAMDSSSYLASENRSKDLLSGESQRRFVNVWYLDGYGALQVSSIWLGKVIGALRTPSIWVGNLKRALQMSSICMRYSV